METENNNNNNNNTNKSKWGTWEELVLGSAVKKHGADNWDRVSLELQARKLSPYVFSSEDCKAKYHALQGRFKSIHGNSCSNSLPWLEELRKLRVAQLKRELERYDGSIVSLESKLNKLKTEREQSLLKEQQKTTEKHTSQQEPEKSPEEKEGKDGFHMCPETDPSDRKREDGKIEPLDNPNRPLENPDPGSGNPNEDLGSKEALAVHDEIRDENPHGEQDLPLESAPLPSAEGPVPQQPDSKTLDKEPAKPETISGPASPLDSYYGSSETIAKEHPIRMGSEQEEDDVDDRMGSEQDDDRMGSEQDEQDDDDDDDDDNDVREQVCVESTDVHSETVVGMKGSGFQECSAESREIGEEGKGICEKRCDRGERLQPWDSNDVLSSAELSSRRRDGRNTSSNSHDASETVRGHYKDYEDSMGPWQHQATRSSGDSQVEGTDEMSPMSKRSRREAKVPGKLIPLLECLRAISAHKFGSLFKHRLESQDNLYYQSMIRRHVDLAMVRSRLEEGSYSGSVEFFRDLLLVFNNALVYYSKYSQEFVAAYVLRELATKEMANIFQTEALLKQEGPSTRKREPRKLPEFSPSAKPNSTSMVPSRKRNASTSHGEYQVGCPKGAQPALEQSVPSVIQVQQPQQVENRKEDETKDDKIKGNKIDEQKVVEISASPSMTQILEKQREHKTDAAKARTAANSSAGNAREQSIIEKIAVESKERIRDTQYLKEPIVTSLKNNHQTKKTPINNKIELKKGSSSKNDLEKNSSDLLAPMKSSGSIFRAKKSSASTVEPTKGSGHIIETNKSSGNIAKPMKSSNTVEQEMNSSNAIRRNRELKKKEQQDNFPLTPPLKQPLASTSTTEAQPLIKRGVGRPPKHAKQASQQQKTQLLGQKQQAPELKATESELLLPRPRKRSRS